MESSAAGVAALALFVLWLGFWVPHHLRLRQQLVDSRVDDRFSAGLRVLAVADGPSPGSGRRGGMPGPAITTDGSAPLLAPGPPSHDAGGERPMDHDEHRDALRGPTGSPRQQPRASRLAMLERRAARARRRLLLTLLLLLATAAGWAVVATGMTGWYAGAVPSGLLLVVLVLGRFAARSARRSDARWAAERRAAQREATQARALANGGPYVPRNRARVTGHAVRPSTTHTQMIPRVSASSSAGRPASSGPADDVATSSRPLVAPEPVDRADPVGVVTTAQARREPVAREARDSARDGGDGDREVAPAPEPPERVTPPPVGSEPWDPVPVPLPTYVTKPTAPRRTPSVSSDGSFTFGRQGAATSLAATMDGALGPTATPARAAADRADDRAAAPDDGADRGAGQTADRGATTAGDEPRPRTETLGLPLEQILARRRAAG